MSIARLYGHTTVDADDVIDQIKDTMVSGGWTLYDDQSASDYYILTSTGESEDQATCYACIDHSLSSGYVNIYFYQYWNNGTHAGSGRIGNTTAHRVAVNEGGGDTLYVWSNKDFVCVACYSGGGYDVTCIQFSDGFFGAYEAIGSLDSGVSSGSDVVCALAETDSAANFKSGDTYQILGSDNDKRQLVTLSGVDPNNEQITISSLSQNYSAGSRVGNIPNKWICLNHQFYATCIDSHITSGNVTGYYSTLAFLDANFKAAIDPDERTGKYIMLPLWFVDPGNYSLSRMTGQYVKYLKPTSISSSLHTITDGLQDSGTSSGSNTSTALNDTAKTWDADAYNDFALIITGGTGAGQTRLISDTTTTQLVIDSAWDTTPDATSTYNICRRAWRLFYFSSDVALVAREV